MKKKVLILGLFFTLLLGSMFVTAQESPAVLPGPIKLSQVQDFLNGVLNNQQAGPELFTRLLIVLLLTAVLYKPAVKLVPDGETSNIPIFLSLIVAILGVRFLTGPEVIGLMLPFGALGIALTTIIPIVLFGAVMTTSSGINEGIARLGWLLMGVSFIVLWFSRFDVIGNIAWIYLWAGLICIFMLFYEKTIRMYVLRSKSKAKGRMQTEEQVELMSLDIDNLMKDYRNAITLPAKKSTLKKIKDKQNSIAMILKEQSK